MRFSFLIIALLLSACAHLAPPAEKMLLQPAAFSDLPGFDADAVTEALPALKKSCARLMAASPDSRLGADGYAGTIADWQAPCKTLLENSFATDDDLRRFLQDHFTPYAVFNNNEPEGLFTGYYVPLLHGSTTYGSPYTVPLYARPADLITVNLGDFRPELKGQTIMGRVTGENLVPYYARADIDSGALKDLPPIVWVDSAVDAFFLHVQGSGQVELSDGARLNIGYAAQNGRVYYAIGRELVKRGELTKDNVSMQAIRGWLADHPDQAAEIMNLNASYVFFRTLNGEGPLGAEGVPLTPKRSLAVDHTYIPYGAPLFLDAESTVKSTNGGRLRRLMVAQDTGGAIAGVVRGDFFWGAGSEAEQAAGVMKSRGRFYILLPKTIAIPESMKR